MSDPYTIETLDNGLRIVIEVMPDVPSAAAGFLVRTGSRDETADLAGVSHFLEHMMFKGTPKRSWREINVQFDALGSMYNAFTSHDRTFYFGWVPRDRIDAQIELLADMMRSALPPGEFDMEKNVILEEIAMSNDHIEHVAMDALMESVYAGHALAWPILGYEKTVRALQRDQMWDYFHRRYAPDHMTLIVAGSVDPPRIIDLARRYCADWTRSNDHGPRRSPAFAPGRSVKVMDRFKQQVLALAFPSAPAAGALAETASAATAILGGDNSRFFWNIVQAGVSPRAGAFLYDWQDTGLMILWGACEPKNSEKLLGAIQAEAQRIYAEPVVEHEVSRVKNKRRTSLAVEGEAPYHRLTQIMDDVDYRGAPRTVEQRLAEVDAVTPATIAAYFEQYPVNREPCLISVGPRNWPGTD